MKLKNYNTDRIYEIYGTRKILESPPKDLSDTEFLIWTNFETWEWINAFHFYPMEEEKNGNN